MPVRDSRNPAVTRRLAEEEAKKGIVSPKIPIVGGDVSGTGQPEVRLPDSLAGLIAGESTTSPTQTGVPSMPSSTTEVAKTTSPAIPSTDWTTITDPILKAIADNAETSLEDKTAALAEIKRRADKRAADEAARLEGEKNPPSVPTSPAVPQPPAEQPPAEPPPGDPAEISLVEWEARLVTPEQKSILAANRLEVLAKIRAGTISTSQDLALFLASKMGTSVPPPPPSPTPSQRLAEFRTKLTTEQADILTGLAEQEALGLIEDGTIKTSEDLALFVQRKISARLTPTKPPTSGQDEEARLDELLRPLSNDDLSRLVANPQTKEAVRKAAQAKLAERTRLTIRPDFHVGASVPINEAEALNTLAYSPSKFGGLYVDSQTGSVRSISDTPNDISKVDPGLAREFLQYELVRKIAEDVRTRSLANRFSLEKQRLEQEYTTRQDQLRIDFESSRDTDKYNFDVAKLDKQIKHDLDLLERRNKAELNLEQVRSGLVSDEQRRREQFQVELTKLQQNYDATQRELDRALDSRKLDEVIRSGKTLDELRTKQHDLELAKYTADLSEREKVLKLNVLMAISANPALVFFAGGKGGLLEQLGISLNIDMSAFGQTSPRNLPFNSQQFARMSPGGREVALAQAQASTGLSRQQVLEMMNESEPGGQRGPSTRYETL